MKKSRAVRLVVLAVIVCLTGLLQAGSVMPTHGWPGKIDEAKPATSSPSCPSLSCEIVDQGVDPTWVPLDTYNSPLYIIDKDLDSYYKLHGGLSIPGIGIALALRGKPAITFEGALVSKLRVKFDMDIWAKNEASYEYEIKAYYDDQAIPHLTWEDSDTIGHPPEEHVNIPVDEQFDVNQFIDKIEVRVWGEGKEWGKDPIWEGPNDVDIDMRFFEVKLSAVPDLRLQPDKYRWIVLKWDPYPCVFEGSLQVRIDNRSDHDALNVTAQITGSPNNTDVPDPDVTVGDIPAGGLAWSEDTFTVRVTLCPKEKQADPCEGVFWKIEYDDECDLHHVNENVPEFPPGEGPCD